MNFTIQYRIRGSQAWITAALCHNDSLAAVVMHGLKLQDPNNTLDVRIVPQVTV